MELMRERESERVADDFEDYYNDERGFAVGDYWNLASCDRPETPERFKVVNSAYIFIPCYKYFRGAQGDACTQVIIFKMWLFT